MSERKLPVVIDVFRLAEQRAHLVGNLVLKDMLRLEPLLVNTHGNVAVDLAFATDNQGLPVINGRLDVMVQVICQRCLKPMPWAITDTFTLSPVVSLEQAETLPEAYEPLLVEAEEQTLIELIEDELILRVPMVAMHEPEECSVKLSNEPLLNEQPARPNPFDALLKLKKNQE
jgi:uncharacterized protein